MPSVYNPTAVQLGSITIPSDGDTRTAATINVPVQATADGVAFINAQTAPLASLAALAAITTPANGLVRNVVGFGLYVFQTSATTGISPFRVAATDATAGGWVSGTAYQTTKTTMASAANLGIPWLGSGATTPYSVGPYANPPFPPVGGATTDFQLNAAQGTSNQIGIQWNSAVTTASAISRQLRIGGIDSYLVDGATLASVTARISGSAHAALPLLMPQIGIVRTDGDGVRSSLLSTGNGLAIDTSATVAIYQALHSLVITPNQNNVIDKATYSYEVMVWNEGNTNALPGLFLGSFAFAFNGVPDARRS